MSATTQTARRVPLSLEEIEFLAKAVSEASTDISHHQLADRLTRIATESRDPDYQRLVAAYRAGVTELEDGALEMDSDAEVNMGEDPGAYVMVWTWVSSEDAGLCRTCACAYDGCGDGWDGECPDCADKTEAKRGDGDLDAAAENDDQPEIETHKGEK